jgi:hypothetical protein
MTNADNETCEETKAWLDEQIREATVSCPNPAHIRRNLNFIVSNPNASPGRTQPLISLFKAPALPLNNPFLSIFILMYIFISI